MAGISDADLETLDFLVGQYDVIGVPPSGIGKKLYDRAKTFSPPATRDEVNDYIDSINNHRAWNDRVLRV